MEKIDFKLVYTHVWIDHPLRIITKINDRTINVDVTGSNHVIVEKQINLQDANHELYIQIDHKNKNNTVIDEKNNVLQDTLVTIKSLEINQIELSPLIYNHATHFFKIKNQPDKIMYKMTEIGYNGTWQFSFKSPIYDWMLESLYL